MHAFIIWLPVAAFNVGCNVATPICATGDIYCNPMIAGLLYLDESRVATSTVQVLPGRMVALKAPANAGDWTFSIDQGSGWLTERGIFTARASTSSAVVTALNGDGTREDITITMKNGGDGTFDGGTTTAACGNAGDNMEVADFNADGNDDVIVGCSGAANFLVFLGSGDGALTQSANIATPANVRQVSRGDFNGDGILDAAATFDGQTSPGLGVYLGNGDGSFQSILPFDNTQATKNTGILRAADFDNDGVHDLVLVNGMDVDQYRGTGDASALSQFSLGAYSTANGANAGGSVEDYNGDGFVDLMVGVVGELDYHQSDGTGVFTGETNFTCGGGFITQDTVATDFDNDGNMDIACNQNGNATGILTGRGDGTFTTQTTLTTNNVQGGDTADFNGDGALDLVASDSTNNFLNVFLGNGDGSFQTATTTGTVTTPTRLRVGDFNGDGKADVAVRSGTNLIVLLGN